MIGFPLKICVVENLTDFFDLLPSAEGFAQALTSKRAPDSVRAGAHGRQKAHEVCRRIVRVVLKRREGRSKAKLNI
jgi:hypothetical protein